jgi:hypothetical protein
LATAKYTTEKLKLTRRVADIGPDGNLFHLELAIPNAR